MSRARPTDRRLWWLLVAAGALSALWLLATIWVVGASLTTGARAQVWSLLRERVMLLFLMWVGGMAAVAWGLRWWFDHWITPSVQLAEEARVLLQTDVVRELPAKGSRETRALGALFNQFVAQREDFRRQMSDRVREAAEGIEQERNRLAALMAELTQSVVVCNLDGRILLYNQRARQQFRTLSQAPDVAGGAELVGLGRSIYAVFDRKLVAHALENIQQRLLRQVPQPAAQFITTTEAGQLLRVQMAPVLAPTEDAEDVPVISGFVLMLDNITRQFEAESARDRVLNVLTERSRASLANMRAAIEMLDFPDLDTPTRERFMKVVREEVHELSHRVAKLEGESAESLRTRWPLEDMLGADLVTAAARRIETVTGLVTSTDEVDAALWIRVESFSLIQALVYLAERLVDEFGVRFLQLRLSAMSSDAAGKGAKVPGNAQLDLVWPGAAMSTETVMSWELDAMSNGGEPLRLTVRDVVERHSGAFWFERERARHQAFFRFLLPLVPAQELPQPDAFSAGGSRPEFYDFDLFRSSSRATALEDRLLSELAYTVFDTETTGLNPSEGDEIIQIGAIRIVNGKLLKQERFEQLIDPRRTIPAATIPIHGIEPGMVAGQPTIDQVLPAFYAFARETVLVAHNAAFDMCFLQLKQRQTGVVFDHPVLDTLLLSAVVHPGQDSHRLEAIAERLNIPVVGRHTAVGDATVTAEVFLRLLPLLADKGIRTLGQAREAAQKTYYARLKY